MNRRAFTLIELLVVVAIITALLAILLPSMGRAVYEAQSAVCASNKRQIGTGTLAYAADFQGYYPSRFADATTHNLPFWWGWSNNANRDMSAVAETYYGADPEGGVPPLLLCTIAPDGVLGSGIGWPNGVLYRGNVNVWAGWHYPTVNTSAAITVLPRDVVPQKVGDDPGRPLAGPLIEYMTGDSVSGHTGWVTPHSFSPEYHYRAAGNPEDVPPDPMPWLLGDGSVVFSNELEKVFRDDGYGSKWWVAP